MTFFLLRFCIANHHRQNHSQAAVVVAVEPSSVAAVSPLLSTEGVAVPPPLLTSPNTTDHGRTIPVSPATATAEQKREQEQPRRDAVNAAGTTPATAMSVAERRGHHHCRDHHNGD